MSNKRVQLDLMSLVSTREQIDQWSGERRKAHKKRPRQMLLFERYAQEALPGFAR